MLSIAVCAPTFWHRALAATVEALQRLDQPVGPLDQQASAGKAYLVFRGQEPRVHLVIDDRILPRDRRRWPRSRSGPRPMNPLEHAVQFRLETLSRLHVYAPSGPSRRLVLVARCDLGHLLAVEEIAHGAIRDGPRVIV